MKIYTKGGDAGETSLLDGARVPKSHERVACYGEVDELNSFVGAARAELAGEPRLADVDSLLADVQSDLFALGAVLADPRRDEPSARGLTSVQVPFDAGRCAEMEAAMDRWEEELPALTNFILPAGTKAATALHVARSVARRAERHVVALAATAAAQPAATIYLNRLSDLLFMAARIANFRLGSPEITWSARSVAR